MRYVSGSCSRPSAEEENNKSTSFCTDNINNNNNKKHTTKYLLQLGLGNHKPKPFFSHLLYFYFCFQDEPPELLTV